MRIFGDLFITGDPARLSETMSIVEDLMTMDATWSRDKDAEARARDRAAGTEGQSLYCFGCAPRENRAAATLIVRERSPNELYVSNIVPVVEMHLSLDRYNQILCEFYEQFARPASERAGVNAAITKTDVRIEDLLSMESATKLRAFSESANRTTGSGHPCDQDRWMEFLLSVHRNNDDLSANLLRRWLVEEEKWTLEAAVDLVSEYEFAKDLLAFAEPRRQAS